MTWNVQDKTFLITGGASGLGAGYVEIFLQQGAKSIAVLDVAEADGKKLVERHNKNHPNKVTFYKCDMSKEEEIARTFDEVVANVKQVDVIINNAGVMVDAPAFWRTASYVNYQGVVSLTLKGVKHMDKSEGGAGGTIMNISSLAAISKDLALLPVYSGAKMGVLHFCRCLSTDPFNETTGVRILCMCFGPTDTPLLQNLEKRTYNPALGKVFQETVKDGHLFFQKAESAVAAVDDQLKNGVNGSIWVSLSDKPGKDVCPKLDKAFNEIISELMS